MNTVLYKAFLVILAVFLSASSIEGSFLSGFGMIAVKTSPGYVQPKAGILNEWGSLYSSN